MAFPDAEERLSHGEPTWFHKGKRVFCMFADHHHDDRVAIWLPAPPGAQEALTKGSDVFFRPLRRSKGMDWCVLGRRSGLG